MKPHPHRVTLSPRALANFARLEYTRRGFKVLGTIIRTDGSVLVDFEEPNTVSVSEMELIEEMGQ